MTESIFDQVRADLAPPWHTAEDSWDAFSHALTSHLPHHGYHDQQPPAQAPAPEDPMTTMAELKNDALALAAKFDAVDEAAADRLAALEGNPVAEKLLEVLHVPEADLAPVVAMLETLGSLVPKPEPEPEPGDAEPA